MCVENSKTLPHTKNQQSYRKEKTTIEYWLIFQEIYAPYSSIHTTITNICGPYSIVYLKRPPKSPNEKTGPPRPSIRRQERTTEG